MSAHLPSAAAIADALRDDQFTPDAREAHRQAAMDLADVRRYMAYARQAKIYGRPTSERGVYLVSDGTTNVPGCVFRARQAFRWYRAHMILASAD